MKFKQQQKITQFRYEVASRRDKLHFSDLLHTYVFMPHIYVLQRDKLHFSDLLHTYVVGYLNI